MSVLDPQLLAKMQEYRRKAADGTLSTEEMKEAIQLMRQGRVSASASATKTRSAKPTSAKKSGDDLLAELDAL